MSQSATPVETPRQPQQPANSQPAHQAPQGAPTGARAASVPSAPQEKRTLAEIFADEAEDGSGESPADVSDDPTAPPDSIDALVKRLNLTHDQVYAIKVAMPGGAEPLTLGEIKDRVGNAVDLEQRELAFDQRRVKAEGDLLRGQTELRELLSMLPKGAVSPEIVNKMRERHTTTMKRERELTLEHIQDWHDEKRMAQDIDGIGNWLHDEYGFDPSFVTTIVDHRAMKFVRDMFLRDQKIKKALAGVTSVTPRSKQPSQRQAPPRNPGAHQSPSNRRSGAVTQEQKLMAVLNK